MAERYYCFVSCKHSESNRIYGSSSPFFLSVLSYCLFLPASFLFVFADLIYVLFPRLHHDPCRHIMICHHPTMTHLTATCFLFPPFLAPSSPMMPSSLGVSWVSRLQSSNKKSSTLPCNSPPFPSRPPSSFSAPLFLFRSPLPSRFSSSHPSFLHHGRPRYYMKNQMIVRLPSSFLASMLCNVLPPLSLSLALRPPLPPSLSLPHLCRARRWGAAPA